MSSQEQTVDAPSTNALGVEVGLRPVVDDHDTRGWFEAAAQGRLCIQECAGCAAQQWPPRPLCRGCHGTELVWREVPGRGHVHTWTVVTHQINPSFPVPYTVVLVDVVPREGDAPVRFLGHLAGAPALEVGTPLDVTFVALEDDVTLPNWVLAEQPSTR